MAAATKLTVVLPKNLLKGARSRQRPAEQAEAGQAISTTQPFSLMNETARNYRRTASIPQLIRFLAKSEGPISTAVHNIVQVANTSFSVTAYDSVTHAFSLEGSLLAKSILATFQTLYDYTEGFSTKKSLEALISQALREVVLTGGLSAELVLNEARLPSAIQIVPIETLEIVSDGKGGFYPQQRVSGQNEPVKLNIPTFWLSFMQEDAGSVVAYSMMQSALKLIIYFEEFMEDIRRGIRKNGHTRTTATLDSQKIIEAAPPEVKKDPVKLKAWMDGVRDAVQEQLEAINPEDAIVTFDTAKVENLQAGLGSKVDYTPLLSTLSGMYATSMKTPPSALGMRLEGGSQALGNVESLVFIKSATAIQTPVEEVFSRALTLACRLYGQDVYIDFSFDPINLRPEDELEAFKTMKQARILELLSLGFLTDEEAAHRLNMGARPAGAPPLSGTMFRGGSTEMPNTAPGDTAMGRTLQPDKEVPRKGGGRSQ